MEMKHIAIITSVLALCAVLVLAIGLSPIGQHINLNGSAGVGLDLTSSSIHATITITRNGEKILEQYHAGAVTILGTNFTVQKHTGPYTGYNASYTLLNCTFVSIGNKTVSADLNTSCTVLPFEWNRTSATLHDVTVNSWNLTAVFHPDVGPQTADCIGINFEDGVGNNALWAYDTFGEVTGIDNTFTITIEFKITVS